MMSFKSLNIKYVTVISSVIILCCVYDFNGRILSQISLNELDREHATALLPQLEISRITSAWSQKVIDDYALFNPEFLHQQQLEIDAQKLNQVEGVAEKLDEETQEGELEKLLALGNQLTLKAVIQSQETFAVIEVVLADKKETNLVKLAIGETIYGYTLTIINQHSITLVQQGRQIELLMYKRPVNAK